LVHARGGELLLGTIESGGVTAIAKDDGPGILDVESALRDGFSTGNGLGLGLPSARRLVDRFDLWSIVGQGTVVRLEKWASGLPEHRARESAGARW
jgi:serine/threonine-protein kinase RsbT